MPTTLTNGIQLPDKGSVDWYSSMQSNYNLIDTHLGDTDIHVTAEDKDNWNSKQGSLSQDQLDAIAQVATNTDDIATLQSSKANASHTHSSSDITDIDDYATKQYVDNSISGLVDNAPDALNTLNELSAALNDDSNFASTVTTALAAKANSADLATVATSGSYNDLSNKPTINNSTITIQKNGSTVDTFTTNGSAKTINIPVPTKTSDLTNDSNFVDTSNSAVSSGITSAKVTDYDSHIADTDIHVTSSDKTTWNTVTSKANDSDVVHNSGDETISGDKVFNARLIKNIDVVLGTAPSTGKFSNIDISDNNKLSLLQIMGGVYDTGNSYARIFVQNKTADDGTGLSPTGTLRTCGFNINFPSTSTSEGQGSITPRGDKTTDFGLVRYQWRNVWCEKLFLNGTQLDPSAFVTTDTAQTIAGNKTFSSNVNVYNSDSATDTANIVLKNSKAERGSTTNIGEQTISFLDKDNAQIGNIKCEVDSGGVSTLTLNCTNSSNSSSGIRLKRTSTGTFLQPVYNNGCNLGTNGYRWYDVQTRSINGVEPSSLSLPNVANKIDISSYITDLTGAPNQYISPSNGYINLRSTNADILGIVENTSGMGTISRGNNQTIAVYLPVVANSSMSLYAKCTSLAQAYFIPCQGNV